MQEQGRDQAPGGTQPVGLVEYRLVVLQYVQAQGLGEELEEEYCRQQPGHP